MPRVTQHGACQSGPSCNLHVGVPAVGDLRQDFRALPMAQYVLKGGRPMSETLARGRWSRAPLILCIVLGAAPLARAVQIRTVTLPEALAYARARQPSVKSALAEFEARRAEARVPRAQWLPQVGATAQVYLATSNNTTASYVAVPELDIPRVGGTDARTQANASWSPTASTLAGIGIGQEVFDFGRISAQIAVADAYAAMAKANAESVGLDIALGVEEAYHGVITAKEVLTATEDALKRAVTHRDYAAAGVKSGLHPPIDLTRAQADVARLEVRLIQAESGLQEARAALAAAMGSTEPEVDAAPIETDVAAAPAFADAMRTAVERNPDILAAVAQLNARHEAVSAVTRELLPNILASAALTGRAGGAAPASMNDIPLGDGWLPDVANWHVGLILQWNIFDGTVLARRSAAKAREEAARAEVELARMNVGLFAEKSYLDLDAALAALPRLKLAVDAAVANQKQADARFKAGLGNIIELADAEALLTDSELQYAIGEFNVARARAALGRAMSQSFVRENR